MTNGAKLCARGTALRAVCLQVARQRLTQEMIDLAKLAVEAWVSELQ